MSRLEFPPVDEQLRIIRRGAADIIVEAELAQKLERSRQARTPLRVKLGLDPTAPDLHLGHTVVLRKLREDFEIGLGCVGTQPGQIDSADEIVERVKKALQYLPAERITLNPDCGFAPGANGRAARRDNFEHACIDDCLRYFTTNRFGKARGYAQERRPVSADWRT